MPRTDVAGRPTSGSVSPTAGTIVDVKVVTDRETGRSRGFAFVEMSSAAEASEAISQLNGRDVEGRTIKVNEAEERGSRSPRSGTGTRRW